MENLEIISMSLLSALCSAIVAITGTIFTDMRRRPFMQIITFMAFSDMMGSIASAFGFPSGSSLLCPIQSFGFVFFYKASWMWMVMMAYQLWNVANRGKLGLSKLQMHVLCWVVPLVSTLLPLSQVQFGSPLVNSSSWCFFEDDVPTAQAWMLGNLFCEPDKCHGSYGDAHCKHHVELGDF